MHKFREISCCCCSLFPIVVAVVAIDDAAVIINFSVVLYVLMHSVPLRVLVKKGLKVRSRKP